MVKYSVEIVEYFVGSAGPDYWEAVISDAETGAILDTPEADSEELLFEKLYKVGYLEDPKGSSGDDMVNSPSHYKRGGIECITVIDAATKGLKSREAYYVGSIIKYIFRFNEKNGTEDLKKAAWYLERLIEKREKKEKKKVDRL